MKRKTFPFVIFLFITGFIFSQEASDSAFRSFIQNINIFNQLLPQEKVYLHFDNTGYFLGETIWYKAYIFQSDENKPANISKVLYVDLINQDGFLVETKKLKIENGQAYGEFMIPDTLYSGFYEVRAYTAYMLNFDHNTVFSRVFPVYEQPEYEGDYAMRFMREREKQGRINLTEENAKNNIPVKISFFPEGGNLVRGLHSKVAFKATDQEGRNLSLSGKIYHKKDKNVLSDINTVHQGMGSFEFTPDGEEYVAGLTYKGVYYEIPLPEEFGHGYVLSVNNHQPDNLFLRIAGNNPEIAVPLGIIISSRGKVCWFYEINANEEDVVLKIAKDNLPTGVNQITLMDKDGLIYAERLIFVNHGEYEKIKLTAESLKNEYKPFQPVQITLTATDSDDNPLECDLSLSVRDMAGEEDTYNTGNILTDLLLSSELKGFIENPAYYFRGNDIERQNNLDLLLLTQGWRRYNIRQMAGFEKFSLKYKPERDISISGTVLTSLDKWNERKIIPEAQVKAWTIDGGQQMSGELEADFNGKFHFSFGDIEGNMLLGLQANVMQTKGKDKGKWLKVPNNILLDRINPPLPKNYSFYETDIPLTGYGTSTTTGEDIGELAGFNGMHGQLQEVTVTEKRKKRKRISGYPPAVILDVADEMDLQIDLFGWFPDGCQWHTRDKESLRSALLATGLNDTILDPIIDVALSDTSFVDIDDIYGMDKNQFMRYIIRRNSTNKSAEIRAVIDALRLYQKNTYDFDRRRAIDMLSTSAQAVRMQNPPDPCIQAFAGKIQERLGLPSLTKVEFIYDLPELTTNVFYLDYIDKIMIYTDRNIRDNTIYKKPSESWVADIAIRFVPYKVKNYRRPRAEGIRISKLSGYSQVREFYNPDYSNEKIPDEPDLRRTLYWNPNIKTDKDGKAVICFYNNSTCREITVNAEGITKEGFPVTVK